MVFLWGVAVSYERGTPVGVNPRGVREEDRARQRLPRLRLVEPFMRS